jgi:3-oxoacyl-[acyl-carrier-protein] synthase III
MDSMFTILAAATALPSGVTTSDELAADAGVSTDWIERRCGIDRRFVARDETATSLGAEAVRQTLERSRVEPDLLLCATYSPDRLLTPIAPAIATQAGLGRIAAFDINAACSGGLVAFLSAVAYISSGLFRRVLVVATDTTTKHLARTDLKTRMLFSDGAAAILLGPARDGASALHVKTHCFGSDGRGRDYFFADWAGQESTRPTIKMDGPALFRFAVETGTETVKRLCGDAQIEPNSLKKILVHQSNARISAAIRESLGLAIEKMPDSLHRGNLAGASLLFLFADELASNVFRCGDLFALVAFGAGLTWAGAIVEVGC